MEDIHIKVLKYAEKNPGFTLQALRENFPTDFTWIEREIQHSRLFQTNNTRDDRLHFLSFDDRFKLLEHEELKEARTSSRRAMYVAITSILLTLSGLVYQFFSVASVQVVNIEELKVSAQQKSPNNTLNSTPKNGAN